MEFYCSHCGILSTGWSHCEIYFPQGGHTVKFYCSHCGILSTGWSHCETFSTWWPHCEILLFTLWNIIHITLLFTGWPHCEILLFTLWNIIHRVVTLWNISTGWPHCEILLFTLWNIIHRVATLWNSIVHTVEYFSQGGHTVKSSFTMWASKFTLWNRTSLCEHSVVNHTVEVPTVCSQSRLCKHTVNTLCDRVFFPVGIISGVPHKRNARVSLLWYSNT